ncbi:hypothetical protein GCM10009533_37070 [Saccharopolyspora spinosporotrichia]
MAAQRPANPRRDHVTSGYQSERRRLMNAEELLEPFLCERQPLRDLAGLAHASDALSAESVGL